MSQDEKKISLDLSEEISSQLQLDDFVWIENKPEVLLNENLKNSGEVSAENVNIAQHDINTERSENAEEYALESNVDTEHNIITPSEWEKGLVVEQHYWEQYGFNIKTVSSNKPKYPASQRLTMKDHCNIERDKRRNRDPSHYKFDYSTTVLLKILLEQKQVGAYHNVVGKGNNSVVICAEHPCNPYSKLAVKVYKLSTDVDKNNAIYKRVQREYAHLSLIAYSGHIPHVMHRVKNIIITRFIGEDQETAQSLSFIPFGYCRDTYQLIIGLMDKWYKKFDLVHGNLCKKNMVLVVYSQNCYSSKYVPCILGWSHSVKTDHPQALVKLLRDCRFVTSVS